MAKKIAEFIFFGNYFIGILAIALSLESAVQLRLPFNSITYYLLLFSSSVMYYTYAYSGPLNTGKLINPRTEWYKRNARLIFWSQRILLIICITTGIIFLCKNYISIDELPFKYWLVIIVMLLAALLYYGLLPMSFYKINLRNTGWLKAFTIGFVWACSVNLLSFIVLQIEKGFYATDEIFLVWLFIKNFMFCTVNAIMFDIKDYADDSNRQLKTFVVKYGLKKTISFILVPMILVGLLALLGFTIARHLGNVTIFFNLIPFILLLLVALSLQKPHKLFYYLVVIDGLILLKAICGIAGMQFVK